jgi:RNA polymerase sigma-70 factor, ECF subfamily
MDNTPNPDKKNEIDFNLIRAFLQGDNGAFDKLVIDYQNRVFNTCYRMLGDYHEANDCAQDIFVKVFRSLNKFRFQSSFSTWLFRIAVNTCRNKLRSAGYRHRMKSIELAPPGDGEDASRSIEVGDDRRTPEKELIRKEKGLEIQRAINSLSRSQKTIVILRDIEGFTYEEISSITGLNTGTVKSRLARARKKLRTELSSIHFDYF